MPSVEVITAVFWKFFKYLEALQVGARKLGTSKPFFFKVTPFTNLTDQFTTLIKFTSYH